MHNVDISQLKKLRGNLSQDYSKFLEDTVKEIAARLLRKIIKRTPVDKGTLRQNWSIDTIVKRNGDIYTIEVFNNTEYANYVEYGHRTANHKGWVEGQFMMTVSEREIQSLAPKIIEKRIKEKLGEYFK